MKFPIGCIVIGVCLGYVLYRKDTHAQEVRNALRPA